MDGLSPVSSLPRKALESFRREGTGATVQKIAAALRYRTVVHSKSHRRNRARIFALPSAEQRFTEIYRSNYWLGGESVSGPGSSIRYTSIFQAEFRRIIGELSIETIFDGPCGDFNWMKSFLSSVDVSYIGGDIVAPLVDKLAAEHTSPTRSFVHIDLTCGPLPNADLMLCRDCLFHLSYDDTERVLRNFLAADIPYILMSNHRSDGDIINRDIVTGDFRHIDLYVAPYFFPTNPLYSVDDSVPSDPKKRICLWSRSQVEEAVERMGRYRRSDYSGEV